MTSGNRFQKSNGGLGNVESYRKERPDSMLCGRHYSSKAPTEIYRSERFCAGTYGQN